MAITLTPDQQTKLDEFEAAAQLASEASTATQAADADLAAAQITADHDKIAALGAHGDALAKAQVFIDSMIPPTPAPANGAAAAAKKP